MKEVPEMKQQTLGLVAILISSGVPSHAIAGGFLGTAEDFAVLAGSAITNTGPTMVFGDLGLWPGTSVTGFLPGVVVDGAMYVGNAVAEQAQGDLAVAYNSIAGMPFDENLTAQGELGGLTLTPGVYFFDSSALLSTSLTLDAMGDPDALFIFQIGSTLTTASASSILTINEADGCNVYWQVGSSATLGTGTIFQGNILALASITLNTGATILEGRALARNGAVTLDTNVISSECLLIPSAGTPALLALGAIGIARRRSRPAVHHRILKRMCHA